MSDSPIPLERVAHALRGDGLTILGRLDWPARAGGLCNLALIGDAAGGMWPVFEAALEYADGLPDPLDRWTRRVVGAVADRFQLAALYPFDGPDFYPFIRWAMTSGRVGQSLLGMGIHDEYGLWHAYRAALVLAGGLPAREAPKAPAAALAALCSTCVNRPCLNACPVVAFTPVEDQEGSSKVRAANYDASVCLDFLRSGQAPCVDAGCLARNACPYLPNGRYGIGQQRFHVRAFLRAEID